MMPDIDARKAIPELNISSGCVKQAKKYSINTANDASANAEVKVSDDFVSLYVIENIRNIRKRSTEKVIRPVFSIK